uniref:Glycosyltransferase family 2 protein n=1 Tax=Roseihalotalea indica TaxID=2867963 RepID=A0AA49GGW8_9BACT|nr:glycosyltransferase family 2 protein [Tunicatimonas sp. TK19036]
MKVSIITVDYNNPEVTLQLLASIEALELHHWVEVVVVDNGSHINGEPLLTSRYPWVVFVRSEKNLGFAGGNNLGIGHASGDYFFFINNDTELQDDIVSPLAKTLEEHPQLGILCPEIRYHDQPEVIQYTGFTKMNRVTGRNRCLTHPEPACGLSETSFPHGAAMMISRRVVEEVGMMPEHFFLYYEEHDWAEMIRRAGYRIAILRDMKIYHKESMSVGKIGELKMYFMTRNRLLFMRRNYRGISLIFFWLYFLLIAAPKNAFQLMIQNDWKNIGALWAGVRWNLSSSIKSERIGYKFDHLRFAS